MKNEKISRRSFLKASAVASALGVMAAAPAAHAAGADEAAAQIEEENCLLKKPKYIFLFIGDGMGTAQIQSARFYKGTVDNNGAVTEADLSFTSFPHVGSVTTYDSTSFCPDSASTATSIATGHKTESGVINMCPWTRDVPYETIAEKLHAQKGYKVGVVSTVNIDHATPAAFYAHQNSRRNYYEIGVELANSGFEYFAGGEFQKVNGSGNVPNNHEVAAQAGYNVVTTQAAAAALTAGADKTLILVTADHETGGMSIGYKTTNYDTFLTNLAHQKMSYAKFDSTYVEGYMANKTPFETAMQDVKNIFGLTLPTDPDAANAGKLLLTDYEVQNLRTAYDRTLEVGSASQKDMTQQDYELYGTYIPFSMAICHTINHKSGMDHTTYAHTGAMVNLYAMGVGAEKFGGVYDNTEVFHKLAELTSVQ